MTRRIPFFIFALIFILGSCGPDLKGENLKLREEIIGYHDEVMPLMGKLKTLEKEAVQEIEKLEGKETPDSARIMELKSLAVDLNATYEGMFDWMHGYDVSDGDMTQEELKVYLEDQLVKVKQVNNQFKEVLEKAENLLGD
ncbi:hypothetical protein JYB64_10045 [Algoriphagus aestuarii]|nr:hypothetical protein [Algoriphagus aestuarii]